MTVADLITSAFKRINVYQATEAPSADDMADAFTRLKMMLGQWRLQRLTIPFVQRVTWAITSSKGTLTNPYTVGTGGDINVARPSLPNEIVVRYQDTTVTPTLERRLTAFTDDVWEAIPQKDLTSPLPVGYYYSPTYAASLGSLYLYYVPTQSGLQGVLYVPASLQDFSATSDTLTVPDGYEFALQENLAVVLHPEWRENIPVDPALKLSALDALNLLKTGNLRMVDLGLDPAVTSGRGLRYAIQNDGPV